MFEHVELSELQARLGPDQVEDQHKAGLTLGLTFLQELSQHTGELGELHQQPLLGLQAVEVLLSQADREVEREVLGVGEDDVETTPSGGQADCQLGLSVALRSVL